MSAFPDTPETLLKKMSNFEEMFDNFAWARFVELYTPVLRTYFLAEKGVTPSEADDLVQDLFVRLVNVLRTGGYDRAKSRFRTFLSTLVRNILIDRHRRRVADRAESRLPLEDVAETLCASGPSAAEQVEIAWRLALRQTALEHVFTRTSLAPLHREIYQAYVLDGEKAKSIASRLGVTEELVRQVKARVNRAVAAVEREYVD